MLPLDLQLNGYKGIDFNADDLSAQAMRRACRAVRDDGGGHFLATVITDRLDRMLGRIGRLADLHRDDAEVAAAMVGIHVEGPFLSPRQGFVGAHPAQHVLPAEPGAARDLVAAGAGLVRLMTLAPEHDPGLATTRWLADRGVVVSAGHCDPDAATLRKAIAAGLAGFTHLGNACPTLLHRHDNILYRVLTAEGLRWVMVIADGVHLPPPLIRLIARVVGVDRLIAVTDATAAGGMGAGCFSLAGQEVIVAEEGAAWAPDRSHLVGSTASMGRIEDVLLLDVGLDPDEVRRVTSLNPRRALGAGWYGEPTKRSLT
jgi:N-acetylglucosamine-6-phosphate deacetylase